MNKTILYATTACIMLLSFSAQASEISPYVGAKLRYNTMSNDVKSLDTFNADDNVFGESVAFGLSTPVTGGHARFEIEYNINHKANKKQTMALLYAGGSIYTNTKMEVESQSLMLNAYYDIDTKTRFTPYLQAGLGISKVKGSLKFPGFKASMKEENFAWQAGLGVAYELTDNLTLDTGYRHSDYGKLSEGSWKLESASEEFYMGARYSF